MNFFRSLNKEQWTALVSVAFCALLLLFGFGGGVAPGSETLKQGAEEPFVPFTQRYVELPSDDFKAYWTGKKIFNVESTVKLPIPLIKAPEPREEEMPAPWFRPGPAWEIYNRIQAPIKYPMLTPGSPLVAEANLPTAAEVAELVKLEEPGGTGKPDLRDRKDREFALIVLKSGAKWDKIEKITDVLPDWVFYKEGGKSKRVARDQVKEMAFNNTNEEQYKIDTEKMQSYGPKEADERVKLAQRCIDLGMLPEAKAELKKAIESRKDHLDAILLLGQVCQDTADLEGALATYRAGLDHGASPGELWYEIGRCHRAIGFHEGALAAFEKAVEAQPRLHRGRLGLVRGLLDSGSAAAAADGATDFFTKLGNAPDTTPAHRAEAFALRGIALVRTGQLDKARADFAEALKIEPANAEALNGNGAAFALEGQFPQAGPEFTKAIRANQYLTEAWTNLAALFLMGGKWLEAEQLSSAALQRDPASVEAILGLGLAQLLSGKKEAPATFARAEQTDPRNLQVLMVTGLLLLRQGQDEEGLQKFVTALRQEYYFLPAYSGGAAAYLRTARKIGMNRDDASTRKAGELRVNAATLLQAVSRFDANRPGVWAALGCAYAAMQRPEQARDMLRRAKENDPLLFYTRGYIEYYYGDAPDDAGRLALARRDFELATKLETTAVDPFSQRVIADCKNAIDQIDQWEKTDLRLFEEFNGADARQIGTGWFESEDKYGVQITRAAGRGRFAGKQVVRDWGLTSLAHDLQAGNLQSVEVTLYPEKMDKAEFGLSIFHTKAANHWNGFSVGFDPAGKSRFAMNSSDLEMDGHDMSIGWTDIKVAVPNPKEVQLRITVSEKNRARAFNLWFYNPKKAEWLRAAPEIAFNANAGGPWRVAVWTRAWRDQEVLMTVDNIRILDQKRR